MNSIVTAQTPAHFLFYFDNLVLNTVTLVFAFGYSDVFNLVTKSTSSTLLYRALIFGNLLSFNFFSYSEFLHSLDTFWLKPWNYAMHKVTFLLRLTKLLSSLNSNNINFYRFRINIPKLGKTLLYKNDLVSVMVSLSSVFLKWQREKLN